MRQVHVLGGVDAAAQQRRRETILADLAIVLANYPSVIDPAITVLETKAGESDDSEGDRWVTLCRVSAEAVHDLVAGIPIGVVHFFGISAEASHNDVLLCYDTGGRISHVMYRSDDKWAMTTVPDDVAGKFVSLPAVRLVFSDERARSAFLYYIERVLNGKIQNPSLAIVFDKLAEPVRVLDVWASEKTMEEGDA